MIAGNFGRVRGNVNYVKTLDFLTWQKAKYKSIFKVYKLIEFIANKLKIKILRNLGNNFIPELNNRNKITDLNGKLFIENSINLDLTKKGEIK